MDFDNYEYEEMQRKEQEEAFEAYQQAQREAHSNCHALCELSYVAREFVGNRTRYTANYECKECGLFEVSEIDHDDYLYHKNRGVETRS